MSSLKVAYVSLHALKDNKTGGTWKSDPCPSGRGRRACFVCTGGDDMCFFRLINRKGTARQRRPRVCASEAPKSGVTLGFGFVVPQRTAPPGGFRGLDSTSICARGAAAARSLHRA